MKADVGGGVGVGPGGVKAKANAGLTIVGLKAKLPKGNLDVKSRVNADCGIDVGPAGVAVDVLGFGFNAGLGGVGVKCPMLAVQWNAE